jgi:pimeloyl-[acyl-carrier protein] synthase
MRFNPFIFQADAYPIYRQLRTEDPIHKSFTGAWVLTRYADIKFVLQDSRFHADRIPERLAKGSQRIDPHEFQRMTENLQKWFLFLNPPDHTRLRSVASKALVYWTTDRLRPFLQETVDQLLDNFRRRGTMEVINDFARPLSKALMGRMFWLPEPDHDRLHYWSDELFHQIFEPMISLEGYKHLNQVSLGLIEYFKSLINERKNNLQDDLLSDLITARERGEKLEEEDLLSICVLLMSGGQTTVINLIGNGLLSLLRNPEQLEKLQQHPELIHSAVEELLRYEGPTQMIAREAAERVEIDGKVIDPGELVFLYLASANRDPEQFFDPDRLDITRGEKSRHLSFGAGIHYCVGAAQGRTQGQIAINSLVQQIPDLQLQTERIEWRKSIVIRGLKALPLTCKV